MLYVTLSLSDVTQNFEILFFIPQKVVELASNELLASSPGAQLFSPSSHAAGYPSDRPLRVQPNYLPVMPPPPRQRGELRVFPTRWPFETLDYAHGCVILWMIVVFCLISVRSCAFCRVSSTWLELLKTVWREKSRQSISSKICDSLPWFHTFAESLFLFIFGPNVSQKLIIFRILPERIVRAVLKLARLEPELKRLIWLELRLSFPPRANRLSRIRKKVLDESKH